MVILPEPCSNRFCGFIVPVGYTQQRLPILTGGREGIKNLFFEMKLNYMLSGVAAPAPTKKGAAPQHHASPHFITFWNTVTLSSADLAK